MKTILFVTSVLYNIIGGWAFKALFKYARAEVRKMLRSLCCNVPTYIILEYTLTYSCVKLNNQNQYCNFIAL